MTVLLGLSPLGEMVSGLNLTVLLGLSPLGEMVSGLNLTSLLGLSPLGEMVSGSNLTIFSPLGWWGDQPPATSAAPALTPWPPAKGKDKGAPLGKPGLALLAPIAGLPLPSAGSVWYLV